MNHQMPKNWTMCGMMLGAALLVMPATSQAGDIISFTCTSCTIPAPTGTISSAGDLMVTWDGLGTFDLGIVAAQTGFTSPSFLTSGYKAGWNGSINGNFFNLNNEADTYGIEYLDFTNLGSLPVADEGTYNYSGTYTVTSTASVPEPGSLALLGTGLLGFGLAVRRRQKRD